MPDVACYPVLLREKNGTMLRYVLPVSFVVLAGCEPGADSAVPVAPTVPAELPAAAVAAAAESNAASAEQPESYADGTAGATDTDTPAPGNFVDGEFESVLLANTRQLVTDGLRSGEGYFSADGAHFIYQSEVPGDNPFYQIHLMDLAS